MRWLTIGPLLLAAAVSCAGQRDTELPPLNRIPRVERLWMAEIGRGLTEAYPGETSELVRICGDPAVVSGTTAERWYECRAKTLKPARYRILTLQGAPRETSPVTASLFEERRIAATGEIEFTWTLERTSRPGVRLPWPDAQQAFDYGLHVAGVQRRGEWVRLLSSIPVDGWLPVAPESPGSLPVYVHVSPLETQIVDLSPLLARWPDGQTKPTEGGPVLIQKVVGDVIEFRDEVPSDFACGEDVTDPMPLPPTLRATIAEFFHPDGTPRFFETYTKGC